MRKVFCAFIGIGRAIGIWVLLLTLMLSQPAAHVGERWHFRATIGVDDGVLGRPGAAIFRVFVGNEKVYESPVMKPGDNPILLHIPLQSTDVLTLEVADTGDGHGGDWGNWCDARIQDDSGNITIWLSDLHEQVLQEWISTRKDRNIVGQPLKLQGRIYCRGLGTISGSRMRYADWLAQWQEVERRQRSAERAFAQTHRFLKLEGDLHGAQLWVNGRTVSRLPVDLQPESVVQIRLSQGGGGRLFQHAVFSSLRARTARGSVSLRHWNPFSIQWLTPPATIDLPMLNGAPYPATTVPHGEVQVTYRFPFSNTERALPPSVPGARYTLQAWCALRSPSAHQPTVSVAFYEGASLRARTRLLTPGEGVENRVEVPLTGSAPLRIVVEDGGDGNLGDEVYLGGELRDTDSGRLVPLTSLPYLLEDSSQESVQVYHYLTSEMRFVLQHLSGHPRSAFRVQAPAQLVFDGVPAATARLQRASALVREAQQLWKSGKSSECAERLAQALQMDESHPGIYALRAEMAHAVGRADLELQAWKRLVDISRADLPLRRRAKTRIAELYRQLDGNLPEFEFRLPGPPPPDVTLEMLTQNVWRVHLTPVDAHSDQQAGELRFTVPRERNGWWLQARLDTRGLAVWASLERRAGSGWHRVWQLDGDEPQTFPLIEARLSSGEYRLRMWHEGFRDGVDGAFHAALSMQMFPRKPAPPQQQWTYRLNPDGSAEVEVGVRGAVALPVPFTADGLAVEGARYSLLPPVYEYLSRLELRHAQVLLLQPTGEQATVRFRWLDAAYNVPMTRYAPDRKERFYFRSLAIPGKAQGEMTVEVHLPDGTGEVESVVPEPRVREGSVIRFQMPTDRVAIVTARHPRLETRWLTASYRRMTLHIPDTPFYRRWLPEYLALLMRIYDRERQVVGGYEPEDALFVALTAPAQLSGYGGATWGGPRPETWIASTGRVGPYNLRYESGGDGVEAHELKWVFLHGAGEALPHWLHTGAVLYIEEQGKLAGDTAFPDVWYQRALRPGAQQFRRRFTSPPTPLQWAESDFRQQSAAQRMLGEAMTHDILHTVAQRYGSRVWAELFRRNREGRLGLKALSDRQKDARIVEALVEITGDRRITRMFEQWGFQLPPSPEPERSRSDAGLSPSPAPPP